MFFTVSNVQAPFLQLEGLINGINDEKSMVIQCHLRLNPGIDPTSFLPRFEYGACHGITCVTAP